MERRAPLTRWPQFSESYQRAASRNTNPNVKHFCPRPDLHRWLCQGSSRGQSRLSKELQAGLLCDALRTLRLDLGPLVIATSIRQSNLHFWVGYQLEFGPSIRSANQNFVQGMAGEAHKGGIKSARSCASRAQRIDKTAHESFALPELFECYVLVWLMRLRDVTRTADHG